MEMSSQCIVQVANFATVQPYNLILIQNMEKNGLRASPVPTQLALKLRGAIVVPSYVSILIKMMLQYIVQLEHFDIGHLSSIYFVTALAGWKDVGFALF